MTIPQDPVQHRPMRPSLFLLLKLIMCSYLLEQHVYISF